MAIINFSKPEHDAITQKIQHYFKKEMDQEIGQFDAAFLLNFFTEEIGPYFYNSALHDAQAILSRRMDDIIGAIDELEKQTDSRG
ncbi:MAG: DUF2164 domain-containing protein [Chlorobiales bacterium]|jgi:uncharacterized protein (DUF2164 family)|nr:DUF2164 domain-containing protein [Chlorobiales bacterium]